MHTRHIYIIVLVFFIGCTGKTNSESDSMVKKPISQANGSIIEPRVTTQNPSSILIQSDAHAVSQMKHLWKPAWPEPQEVETLYCEFSYFIKEPNRYEERIHRDAVGYPEGALLALALPAYGFTNYALAHPESSAECQERISQLIQIASRSWVRQWLAFPMKDDVAKLQQWNGHGFYLGNYCLMLACYRLAGGDTRYADQQRRIAGLLKQGFQSNHNGTWISSYPTRAWLFDSLGCLLAIRLNDVQNSTDLRESASLVYEHLRFRQSPTINNDSGFTSTEIDYRTGEPLVGSRGCDISGTICFLSHLAPSYCRNLYSRYKQAFWIDVDMGSTKLSGFREWQPGQYHGMDIDSGPILFDIGAAASGFGLGASRFAGDATSHQSLIAALDQERKIVDMGLDAAELAELIEWFFQQMQTKGVMQVTKGSKLNVALNELTKTLIISKEYHYRHLMADAVAFYCMTWRPWCNPIK